MHKIVDPKGELNKVAERYLSNNYRKMHYIPMIRNNRKLRQYKIKTVNVLTMQ